MNVHSSCSVLWKAINNKKCYNLRTIWVGGEKEKIEISWESSQRSLAPSN